MENKGKRIKPCQYCGGKGKLQNTLSIVCKIVCENCGAESMCCGSEAEAIERWNEVSTRKKNKSGDHQRIKNKYSHFTKVRLFRCFLRWVSFSGKRCMQNVRR